MANWLSRLWARRTQERHDPAPIRIPPQTRSMAGVYVTPDRALTNDVVWACVGFLSSTIAQLPWCVKKELPNGGYEEIKRHPVANVLSWRANPECSPFQFRETLIGWALLWGNGYAEIVRDASGRVTELWPIHPSSVDVRRDAASGALYYHVSIDGGGSVDLDPMDVFHLRGFGDGAVGLNVVEYAAQTIGWAQATTLFGASFFGNGLNMGGFIETAGALDKDGKERLRSEIERLHRGPRNAHRWGMLDAGMKAVKLAATPNEAQYVEAMQHQVDAICRWFRVPPHKVMHLLRGTFSNIEHQSIEVVVDSVSPWVTRLEQEADYKLFGANRQGLCTDIDLRGLMRGDANARGQYYQMMRNVGALSINEIRGFEAMNPVGPAGDVYVMQSQYFPIEQIAEQKIAAPSAPATTTPPDPAPPAAALPDQIAVRLAAKAKALADVG